jgi:hypothetical protein
VCVRVAVRGWWRRLEWLRRNGASPGGFIARPRSEGGNWHVVVIVYAMYASLKLVAKTETENLEIPNSSSPQ